MDQVKVARIKDGIVVNLEVADDEWVSANNGLNGFTFVAYETEIAHIGLAWTEEEGFEQPEIEEVLPTNASEGAE